MFNNRIAILLWLYHQDLWPEFYSLLYPIKDHIHLYLGIEQNSDLDRITNLTNFDQLTISYHANYGADVAPFLNQLPLVKEPLFIKLHSKKSMIGPKKQVHWRSVLLHDLIGSKDILSDNINQFSNPNIGFLSNKTLWWNNREYKNTNKIIEICDILELPYNILKNGYFLAGNMFMSRTNIYQSIFSETKTIKIDYLLQQERGKLSDIKAGRYAHSMERIFGYIVQYKNLDFTYPTYRNIMIKNDMTQTGYLTLIQLYNDYCYIQEDLSIFGKILLRSNTSYLIEWHHMSTIHRQRYNIINHTPTLILEKNNA